MHTELYLNDRMRALEVEIATLKADLAGHVVLCDRRWSVLWKLVTVLSGIIAFATAMAVEMWRR
jgi:hypothetical protein